MVTKSTTDNRTTCESLVNRACRLVVMLVIVFLSWEPHRSATGVGILKTHTAHSDLKGGHSWGDLPQHWDKRSAYVALWKAWDQENKRLERNLELRRGRMTSSLRAKALNERRWPELPDRVECTKGLCATKRKGHVKVSIASSGLHICSDCPDPNMQGSWFDMWPCHWTYPGYHIDADLVYAIPNDGTEPVLNAEHMYDNVVLVNRGGVRVNDLARRIQNHGALALIVIDDGRCGSNFQCGGLGERRPGEGFAAGDDWWRWTGIVMPTFLVSSIDGRRLQSMMPLSRIDVPGYGSQLVCEEDLH